jgi:NAD(P)-dependent dehydrogenase (short-subunit alcohol dehydrogenase family)
MGILEKQIAIIVGAAGGIGSAVVRRYLAEGASILAVDRDPERIKHLEQEFGDNPRLLATVNDTLDWRGNEALIQRAVERFGRVDILISCVGIHDHNVRLIDIPGPKLLEAFDECFRINVGSLLLLIRAAVPELARNYGRVVLTGSFASFRTSGGGVLYTGAKHAIVGVVSQLAYELAPKIRVNGVAPGVASTVMQGIETLAQVPMQSILPGTMEALPLEQLPQASDYAALYALLGSASESRAMTGSMFVADSGLLARGLARANAGHGL